uniref:FRA10A associated CGG repeat 1 n=1 Tax=Salarias fasciatus TaxID=181472 RepID=A0A672JFU7_SALFA
VHGSGGYDSDFSDGDEGGESSEGRLKRKHEEEILQKPFQNSRHSKVAHRSFHSNEVDREEARNRRAHIISLNAFERHKKFVGDYILYYGGQMADFKRSVQNDLDVLRENHRFLWRDEDEEDMTWEKELAKKYYDKLFKEYCIADVSRYRENKFGFRWRTENEVVSGKGQFQCGNKHCESDEGLKSWEVNFAYVEHGEKRNALVKLRRINDITFPGVSTAIISDLEAPVLKAALPGPGKSDRLVKCGRSSDDIEQSQERFAFLPNRLVNFGTMSVELTIKHPIEDISVSAR